jgi:hypothetical protein
MQNGPSSCPTPSTIFRESLSLEGLPQVLGHGTYRSGISEIEVLRPGPTPNRRSNAILAPSRIASMKLSWSNIAWPIMRCLFFRRLLIVWISGAARY